MSDIHIDDFYRDAAKCLVQLYNHFPRTMTLYVEDISGPDTPDEFGLHSTRHQACLHTLLWLHKTDYLMYDTLVRQEALDQAVLSHRAFLLLNEVDESLPALTDLPEPVAREESLVIHRLRRELKEGTSYSLADCVRRLMKRSRELAG